MKPSASWWSYKSPVVKEAMLSLYKEYGEQQVFHDYSLQLKKGGIYGIIEIEDGKIRMPFGALSGVGENAAKALVEGRDNSDGVFVSIDDFQAKTGASSAVVTALKEIGAFADLPETAQISFFGF